jgi:hypothetical protein
MRFPTATALAVFLTGSANAADLPDYQAQLHPRDSRANVAMRTYAVCREKIAAEAAPYSPLDIQAVLIGPVKRSWRTRTAPLHVRITYETDRGREIRRSAVDCQVAGDNVVSLTAR